MKCNITIGPRWWLYVLSGAIGGAVLGAALGGATRRGATVRGRPGKKVAIGAIAGAVGAGLVSYTAAQAGCDAGFAAALGEESNG